MKPNFALNLSHEGILLLHLSPRGTWTEVGSVKLDDPDLRESLSFLRSTAVGLGGKGFGSKLILPDSQILYREIDAPGPGNPARKAQIMAALDGVTPYQVDELTFDWIDRGDRVLVAAVANETLAEAEDFAVEHKFNPISIVGNKSERITPGSARKWEPFFGRTKFSHSFLGAEAQVRDTPPPNAPHDSESLFADDSDGADRAQSGDMPLRQEADEPPENLFAPETPAAGRAASPSPPLAAPAFTSRHHPPISAAKSGRQRPIDRVAARIAILPDTPAAPASGQNEARFINAPSAAGSDLPPDRHIYPSENMAAKGDPGPPAPAGIGDQALKIMLGLWPHRRRQPDSGGMAPQNADGPHAYSKRRRQRLVFSAVAALILLATAGLVYIYFSGGNTVSGARDSGNQPARQTAGIPKVATSTGRPRIARPQRRPAFAGKTSPVPNRPDTAEPVTKLTAQQRADIRAAGLRAPTPEELAEGRYAGASGSLTDAEIAAAYARTGILEGVRTPPPPPANQQHGDIFFASVDRQIEATDAVILPDFNNGVEDAPPRKELSPPGPGVRFILDANGLVKPSKKGTLNPDGILVRLGKPAVIPPARPKMARVLSPNPLAGKIPKARPANLRAGNAAIFLQGRLTRAQLRQIRARPRPQSAQASLATGKALPTGLAVLTSFQPARRPSNFSKTVEKARLRLASFTPKRAAPSKRPFWNVGPGLPTSARVAAHATIKNAINLSRLNLIGVYGTPSKRSALLRLPNGRFVKVKNGDLVDGGRVVAIGRDSLSYVKAGRNRVLKIPN